jgi:hypothetical protein
MNAKHTPGPWKHDANDVLNPERAFGIVRELGPKFDREAGTQGATEVIAEICGDDGSGVAEADARLIAAAPDLLAALEFLSSEFVAYVAQSGRSREFAERAKAYVQARAAIAKAKGRE